MTRRQVAQALALVLILGALILMADHYFSGDNGHVNNNPIKDANTAGTVVVVTHPGGDIYKATIRYGDGTQLTWDVGADAYANCHQYDLWPICVHRR